MEINKELKVEAAKSFPVKSHQLFDAWTKPEQLKQWWKPMGNTLKEVTNDIKKGGVVRYIFDGDKLVISGEYLEAEPNKKLVYTWNWEFPDDAVKNASYKLTVNFTDKGDGSEISVLQENFQNEETLLPHKEGWEKGLTDLENFLIGSATSIEKKQDEAKTPGAESEGYREDPAQVKVGGG